MTDTATKADPSACERWWPFVCHDYGKWEVVKRYAINSGDNPSQKIGEGLQQRRTCARCGFEQLDRQRVFV
jgi:hypothetical protein